MIDATLAAALPFCVIDTETTGLQPDARVVELAVLVVRGTDVEEWSTLVNPGIPIPADTTAFNGIDNSMVADAPTFRDCIPRLFELIGWRPILAHYAIFDLLRLKFEFDRAGIGGPDVPWYCTKTASEVCLPQLSSHSLQNLVQALFLPKYGAHRALDDASSCLDLWWSMQQVWTGLELDALIPVGSLGSGRRRPSRRHGRVPPFVWKPLAGWTPDPMRSHIDREFLEFHRSNPLVYQSIVKWARYVRRGRKDRMAAIASIWERMRWELSYETLRNNGDEFRLNNDYRSRYARLVMEQESDLEGIFELRPLTSGRPRRAEKGYEFDEIRR